MGDKGAFTCYVIIKEEWEGVCEFLRLYMSSAINEFVLLTRSRNAIDGSIEGQAMYGSINLYIPFFSCLAKG